MKRIRSLVALSWVLMVASGVPVGAHTEGNADANDSRSPLDIQSVEIVHEPRSMELTITTFERWGATRLVLDRDRYFLVGLDLDDRPRTFERCVFVFFDGRLRRVITNCATRVLDASSATRPSSRSVSVRLSFDDLNISADHRWVVLSSWGGRPCGSRGCVDAAPDDPPGYFHDITKPKLVFDPPLLSTETSPSTTFPVHFRATDPKGSGIATWELWEGIQFAGPMTKLDQGTDSGAASADIVGAEGAVYNVWIVVRDQQGNRQMSEDHTVLVPFDDDAIYLRKTEGAVSTPANVDAFGGSVTRLEDTTASFSFSDGGTCPQVYLIGDGRGTWTIDVLQGTDVLGSVNSAEIPDAARQVLWTGAGCDSVVPYVVDVTSGQNVRIDAVALLDT